jgi:RHS repeat-associated protein
VNTGSTPNVQYTYVEGANGANNSRLTTLTYPNGRAITFNYNTGVDTNISRLSSITDGSTTLESYSYLGLDTAVKRAHPQPTNGLDLTYIGSGTGDGGDQYTGLDRFGRVVEQKWQTEQATPTVTDDFKYGYDPNGSALFRTNEVNHNFDELYHPNGSGNGYDNLNQLTAFARGTLNANHDTISSPSHSISYSLDGVGNFASTTTDGGSPVSNTFNKQNEQTKAGAANLTFDNNGNTTTDDQGHTLVYDAWNRLVAVKNGGSTLVSYKYDALSRKTVENPGTTNDLFYSSSWQVVEERAGGVSTATIQYVWSPLYVDSPIERDRSTQNNGTLDERLYVQTDANANALVNTSGNVVERYAYDPYGKPSFYTARYGSLSSSAYASSTLFQGGRFDSTASLYNFRLRTASPSEGHWVQVDPVRFGGGDVNLYRSVGDKPTTNSDPTGLLSQSDMSSLASAVFESQLDSFGSVLVGDQDEAYLDQLTASLGYAAIVLSQVSVDPAQPAGPDAFQSIVNGAAGFADGVSGGLTSYLRQWMGTDEFVDHYSTEYRVAEIAGTGVGMVAGANPCGASALARMGIRGLNGVQAASNALHLAENMQQGNYGSAALNLIALRANMSQLGRSCFVAGTPLLTPVGAKPIEEFRPGDLLLSAHEDDPSGPIEAKRVTDVFVRVSPILQVRIGDISIETTAEHPFWVEGRGWVGAGLLLERDRLRSHNGTLVVVRAVSATREVTTVYNVVVEDYHTYFVGNSLWGFSAWVHNANPVYDARLNNGRGGYRDPETGRIVPAPQIQQGRQVGERFRSGQSSTEQFEGIQKAQQTLRNRGQGERIRKIEKSQQREQHDLDRIRSREDARGYDK